MASNQFTDLMYRALMAANRGLHPAYLPTGAASCNFETPTLSKSTGPLEVT